MSETTETYPERHVFVCINERVDAAERGCCAAKGGSQVRDALKKKLAGLGLLTVVRANKAGCLDKCEAGVVVTVYPERVWYGGVTVGDVDEIVERHIIGGEIVERLLLPNQPWVAELKLPAIEIPKK